MHNQWDILPLAFLERMKELVPPEKLDTVLDSYTQEKPTTFRTNTLKITTQELKKQLFLNDIQATQIDWYPDAFILDAGQTKEQLMATDAYQQGFLYIQTLSSMIPALVMNPEHDQIICDLTAAPGSKTTQLASLMENTGVIIANDISRQRVYKLQANLSEQGVTNTRVLVSPGQALWKKYPDYFDSVLVDAPCTMEGRFSTLDPQSYAGWTPRKVKLLSQLQKFLLRAAVSMTKPGGTIIYSTCTLELEENEAVVDWIIKKNEGQLAVEEITLALPEVQAGLMQWKKKHFSPELQKTIRILPSEIMEGFYVAKLRKKF